MFQLIRSAAILLLLGSAAYAQEAFTLTVTPVELQLIGKGLGTQPYETTAPLMAKLQAQVMAQQKPAEAPKVEPSKNGQ